MDLVFPLGVHRLDRTSKSIKNIPPPPSTSGHGIIFSRCSARHCVATKTSCTLRCFRPYFVGNTRIAAYCWWYVLRVLSPYFALGPSVESIFGGSRRSPPPGEGKIETRNRRSPPGRQCPSGEGGSRQTKKPSSRQTGDHFISTTLTIGRCSSPFERCVFALKFGSHRSAENVTKTHPKIRINDQQVKAASPDAPPLPKQ